MESTDSLVSDNLKRIREERNLSLDKMAEMTAVSKSMLRQIEIGQSTPTIKTIWKIANGLHIPLTALLREQSQAISIGKFRKDTPLLDDSPGYRLYPIIHFDPERAHEIYFVEIDPGISLEAESHQGNTEEYVFVIEGELCITINKESYTIEPENFIIFQANCPHKYHNNGDQLIKAFILILYLP